MTVEQGKGIKQSFIQNYERKRHSFLTWWIK